eukprot:gene8724-33687_t
MSGVLPVSTADEEAIAGLCPIECYNLLPTALLLVFSSFPIAKAASPPPAVPDCNVGSNDPMVLFTAVVDRQLSEEDMSNLPVLPQVTYIVDSDTMKTSFYTRRSEEVQKCADSIIITQLRELTTTLDLPPPNVSAQCDETSDLPRRMQGGEVAHIHDELLSRSLQQAVEPVCTRDTRYAIKLIVALGTDLSGVKALVIDWEPVCSRAARYTIELIVAADTDLSGIKPLVTESVQTCTRAARYTIDLIVAPGTDFSGVKALVTELEPVCSRAARYTIDLIVAPGTDFSGVKALVTESEPVCSRAARYTIELIVAPGTDLSSVKALVNEWVNSKVPLGCPIEELVFAEGSIVHAIYTPTEDEVPVSCPEWTVEAIAGLSTETKTDVFLADCLIPSPSPPKPPTPPPTPGGITPGGITPGAITPDLTPIPPPADDDSSAPLGAVIGPSGLATTAASMYGPIFFTPSRDTSNSARGSKSHTQSSRGGSQVEAIPQVGPRLDSPSFADLSSCGSSRMSTAAWRQRSSLIVSTASSKNLAESAYAPDWILATSPGQGPIIKPYAPEPVELISVPYTTGVLSGLAATSTSPLSPGIRTLSRNISRRDRRSQSHAHSYRRGSQVEAIPQVGPGLNSLTSANLYSSSSPRMSAGAWMQRTSLDRSTDSGQKQSPVQSGQAQDRELATSPRQASMIEPDSYPGGAGDRVSKPGSPYSTPGSPYSTMGSPLSTPGSLLSTTGSMSFMFPTPGGLFSHSPDRGSEMGPVLPTRKSHKRSSVSFRTSSTSYPEVATQVADRAKSSRLLGDRNTFSGFDKNSDRRAYSITGSTSIGSNPVIAGSSHSFFKRRMDIDVPTERVGGEVLKKKAWAEEHTTVGANRVGPPPTVRTRSAKVFQQPTPRSLLSYQLAKQVPASTRSARDLSDPPPGADYQLASQLPVRTRSARVISATYPPKPTAS